MGCRQHDLLVSLALANRLVGADFVKPFALNPPPTVVELENRGRVSVGGVKLKRTRIEVNADQGEKSPRLAVASPENLVVPVGRFPTFSERRVGLTERRDEPGFQPFAVLTKEKAGVIDVHIVNDLAERPAENQPGRKQANRQDAGPDDISHNRIPGEPPDMDEQVLL